MAINPYGIVRQIEEQVAQEGQQQQQFSPTLDENQTRQLIEGFKANPHTFSEQSKAQLEQHASYHQIPFYPGDFNFGEAIMQFGKGFASGFTTLETGDHPDNEYENIARSLGHLVGFAPGIMATPLKMLGLAGTAAKVAKVKSVPLWLAGKATKKAKKIVGPAIEQAAKGRAGATQTAAQFLTRGPVKHISEGAFNLGLASGISAWQGGVDAIMHSAGHGAVFGGVFRGLGNVVQTGDKAADKTIRAIAGSVFQGLPSTLRGATSAEQVYEYLLGAYFGSHEVPWHKHRAGRFMRDMQKESVNNAELEFTRDPNLMGKRYHKEEQVVKDEIDKQITKVMDPQLRRARGHFLLMELKRLGVDLTGKITKEGEVTQEGWELLNEINKGNLDKAQETMPELEHTPEGTKVDPAETRIVQKVRQLDLDIAKNQRKLSILEKNLETEKKKGDTIVTEYASDEIPKLKENILTLQKERIKILDAAKSVSEVLGEQLELDFESEPNSSGASNRIVGWRAQQFAEKHLKKIWDLPEFDSDIKADLKTLTANEVAGIFQKHISRGKEPNTESLMEELNSRYKTGFKDEIKGEIRQWLTKLNHGQKQRFLRIVYDPLKTEKDVETGESTIVQKEKIEISDMPESGQTAGGNRKIAIEPPKVIEEIYYKDGGKPETVGSGKKKRVVPPIFTFNDISVKDEATGSYKDMKLSRLRETDELAYKKIIREITKSMEKKKFYLFGGRGDADKLIFVKYHPHTKKHKLRATLQKVMKDKKDIFNYSRDMFVKQNPDISKAKAMAMHRRAFVSNVLYDLGMNGLEYTPKNLEKIWYDGGFLANSLAFNKRAQIMFTPSWSGSPEAAISYFGKEGLNDKNFLGKKGQEKNKLRYILIDDLGDLPKGLHPEKLTNYDATFYGEIMDGAIIGTNRAVDYNNIDGGHVKSGQNKAFIVSPHAENGALLGKFMFHNAGDKLSAAMEKAGIHYIIPKSAAKQLGLRQITKIKLGRTRLNLEDASIYDLDPSHIKYNYTVKNTESMVTHLSRIPKQWFSALNSRVPTKPVPTDIIEDIFNETIYKKYKGDEKWNAKLRDYMENPESKKEAELLNNIEKIGINDLLEVINSNEGTAFADGAYQKLLRLNKEIAYENAKEDGIRAEDLNEYVTEIEDFNTVTDRLIRESIPLAKGKDRKGSVLFAHKWVRPYRIQVMRNYIISQITKPKIGNSGAARMRPYDLAMQVDFDNYNKNLKLLNKRDDIFFLDTDYRAMKINTHLNLKEKTLGEVWDAYEAGKYKGMEKEIQEVFRAMVVRVPMDSISGAHALNFMGFTGRYGHGVLVHPRSMRALGGADLDGDEAFIYFGGRDGAGAGSGMKKSWKDVFESNKNEFVSYVGNKPVKFKWNPETKKKDIPVYEYKNKDEYDKLSKKEKEKYSEYIPDPKKTDIRHPEGKYKDKSMAWLLTQNENAESRMMSEEKILMYSPSIRREVSERTVEGRNLLGGVATMTKTLKNAHDIMSNVGEETVVFERQKDGQKEVYAVLIKPRQEKEWLDYARRLSTSMVAFTADPMDSAGLKPLSKYMRELYDAYFKIDGMRKVNDDGSLGDWEPMDNNYFYTKFRPFSKRYGFLQTESDQVWKLRKGIVKHFGDLNNAMFSKNWQMNRAHSEQEIRDKLEFLGDYTNNESDYTNILAKQARLLKGTGRWSDNILNKIDIKELTSLYQMMNKLAKQFKMQYGSGWVEKVWGRGTFTITQNQFVDMVLNPKWKAYEDGDRAANVQKGEAEGRRFGREAVANYYFEEFVKDLNYIPEAFRRKWMTKYGNMKNKERKKDTALIDFKRAVKEGKFTQQERVEMMEDILKETEDYIITNDIHDMVSLKLMSNHITKHRDVLTDDVISELHLKAQELKDKSYLNAKERNDLSRHFEEESYLNKDVEESGQFIKDKQVERGERRAEEEGSAKMDQASIDAEIKEFKKGRSAQEQRLFDYFMLGSYNRARRDKKTFVEEEMKKRKETKRDKNTIRRYETMWYNTSGARTSMMKLGFSSTAIPSQSVKAFLKEYMNLTTKTFKASEKKSQLKLTKEQWETAQKLDEMKVEYEKSEVPFIEKPIPKEISESYVGDMDTYEGLVAGKLPKDQAKVITELAENIYYMHNKDGLNLNHITASIMGKPLNEMDKQDYIALNEFLKDIRKGSIWQRLFNEDSPDMKARYWMLFPKAVNKEMMKYDVLWLKKEGWFKRKGKEVFGTVAKPTWWLEGMQDWISRMGEKAIDLGDKLKSKTSFKLAPFVENTANGELLRQFAVRTMEKDLKYKVLTEKSSGKTLGQRQTQASEYEVRYNEMAKNPEVQEALKKKYSVTFLQDGKPVRKKLTGEEIKTHIMKVYKNMNKEIFEIIGGKKGAMGRYHLKDKNNKLKFHNNDIEEPMLDWKLFIKDMTSLYKQGKDIPTSYGVDGLRQIARSMMIDLKLQEVKDIKNKLRSLAKKGAKNFTEEEKTFVRYSSTNIKRLNEMIKRMSENKIAKTGVYDFGTYFPHMFHSKTAARESINRQLEAIEKSDLSEEGKQLERKKIMMKLHNLTGDWMDVNSNEMWDKYDKIAQEIIEGRESKKEVIKWTELNNMSPNMKSRTSHLPGWSIDHGSYEIYATNIANTYFNQLSQIFTRGMINEFSKRGKQKGWDKVKFGDGSKMTLLQKWENYLKLYAQDAMGNPSVIPDYVYNDPGMKVSATPYGWWADNRVKKRMQKMKNMIVKDPTKYENLNELMNEIPYSTLNKISNLEAKFELASLLAHPKSAVGNVFGGSLHTLQSAGYQNWKQGTDIKWLQRINPEWKSKDDINKFIIKHGVIPDFMMHEWGLNPEVIKRGKTEFMKDVVKQMKDGKIDAKTFKSLSEKHELSKSMMNIASQFMSKPEMMLRRHAFMAHYVQAWKRFDGAIDNINHPFLIEQAKAGVKATQFLYSAPFRPAFARTALGKIMTRFQLWQWNAARFRNDIRKEAAIFGLQEGTPAFEKFKRTLQLDLFVFALANVFMYSLFETALPAPWNWLQDTADWVFGDEKERERTFMGTWPAKIAPLQLITPPIARLPVAGLDSFIANDWERFANYHIYTMFPFGRVIKDVSPWAKNNLMENPMMAIDKFSGFPMYGISRMSKDLKKEGVYKP